MGQQGKNKLVNGTELEMALSKFCRSVTTFSNGLGSYPMFQCPHCFISPNASWKGTPERNQVSQLPRGNMTVSVLQMRKLGSERCLNLSKLCMR